VIELMVTVSILAILAAIALPSFNGITERWRVRQTVDGLQSTLNYARSEAIKRGGNVVVQKNANNNNGCTTAIGVNDWDCGWHVCADANGNGTCQAAEILQRFDTPPGVTVTRSSDGNRVRFDRWGRMAGPVGLGFTLIPLDKSPSHPAARALCMSSGGRIRVINDPPCGNDF